MTPKEAAPDQALQRLLDELDGRALELGLSPELLERLRHEVERAGLLRRQAALEDAAQWRTLMDHVPAAVQGFNTDGTVFYWNEASERIFGYAAEEAIGREIGDLIVPPEQQARYRQVLEATRALDRSGEFMPAGELTLRRKDGSRVAVHATHTAVCSPGRPATLFCIDVDISDRKRAEADLIRARAAAEEANEAKSRFLANMSHELRTPMNAIMGMTDLALEETHVPRVRDMLWTARYSADTLLELLDEVLDLARVESGALELEPAMFSLRDLLNQSLKPLALRAAQKGLTIDWVAAAEVPDRLFGDESRLRQVLVNLVGNAIKFTVRGGVAVRAAVIERLGDEALLELSVTDTGIGISPEDQERIFDPFVQLDASTTRGQGGTGLGLAISRRLVELMGGRLRVESRLGQGSTFSFTARLVIGAVTRAADEAALRSSAPPRPFRPARPLRPLRVLLAEDTPANQMLVVYVLEQRGHSVEVADNGRQALDLLRDRDFDAVLMDVQMPVMDGLAATGAIRALDDPRKARLPVIAITAHALKGDEERCLAAGMDAYVSKPIDGAELIRLVERLAAHDR